MVTDPQELAGSQELVDRVALRALVETYAAGCDRRDVAAVTGTFTEEGRLAKYADPGATGQAVMERRGRQAIGEAIAGLSRYAVTTHFLGQQSVALDGDRAEGETYCLAHHHYVHEGRWFNRVMAIRYLDTYRRTGSGWLIEDRRLVTDWIEYRPVGGADEAPSWALEQDAPAIRPLPPVDGDQGERDGSGPAGDLARVAAVQAITNLVSESHFLVDTGRWSELTATVFAREEDGLVPEADFGFAVWRGVEAIDAGFGQSLPRFTAAFHAISNLHVAVDGDVATARYYVQGWHWFAPEGDDGGAPAATEEAERNADFLVLGVMTDQLVRQRGEWRILHRRLARLGPGMAVGAGRPWLAGLGQGTAG